MLPPCRWAGHYRPSGTREETRLGKGEPVAQIAMGVGTSHGPLLNTPPAEWDQRARADRISKQLIYRGDSYDFAGLRAARGHTFSAECALEVRQARHAACRAAIEE